MIRKAASLLPRPDGPPTSVGALLDRSRRRSTTPPMPAPIGSDLVWKEIEKRSFAVLSYVNPKHQARSAGIVYFPIDRVLYVRAAKSSWKAKHILLNPHVALNVTISKRVPFMPWIKIPDATIAFSGTARVLPMSDVDPKLLEALVGLTERLEMNDELTRPAPRGDERQHRTPVEVHDVLLC